MLFARGVCLLATVNAVAACSASNGTIATESGQAGLERTVSTVTVRGAGATFPYPVYSRWALSYYAETGMRLSYDQRGSDFGVEALRKGEVDFGASDVPLSPRALAKEGFVQFPMVIGGVAPVVNVPGLAPGQLRLTPKALADIFMGKITRWDDPSIRATNKGLPLPDREITPVYRADRSGTTWIFTGFLADANRAWRETVGRGATVTWPVGVGAESNDQVARFVRQFKYTIGYVEFSHAVEKRLAWANLARDDGTHVGPALSAFQRAAEQSTWRADSHLGIQLSDTAGEQSWPIIGASYILVKDQQKSRKRTREMLQFFHWAVTEGAAIAAELQYAALPKKHVPHIEELWSTRIRVGETAVW